MNTPENRKKRQFWSNIFLKKTKIKFDQILTEFNNKIEKARDGFKDKVHKVHLQEVLYPLHHKIQIDLGIYSHLLYKIQDELENDKTKVFEDVFNQKFESIEKENQKFIFDKLSELQALNDFFKYIRAKDLESKDEANEINHHKKSLVWKSKTELEFVQLIYSLHEAGYLNHEKNEITTLVTEVASLFNFELSKYWQSNLSDNINNRNSDYQPEIFDKLKLSFNEYRERQIEKNKKKKPK
jgi:hypothetical protein